MNSSQCPNCERALPEYANYCANCGESMTSPGHVSARFIAGNPPGKDAFQGPHFYPVSQTQAPTLPAKTRFATVNSASHGRYANTDPQTSPQGGQQYPVQDVVTQLHAEDARPLTWQRVLDTPPVQEDIPISPRPTSPRHPKVTVLVNKEPGARRISPVLFFWSCLAAVLMLLFAGIFGIFVSFGHGATGTHAPTLLASSNIIAIGATLEIHGTNFTSHGRVGLTRDAILPIADTGGTSIIQADGKGNISDTITVSSDWQAGIHTINAEDATLHKIARFSLVVTGKGASLRPAHFTLSDTALNLGTGDSATNTTQTVTLSNTGGGQITWQASTDQPWLLLSPDNGTFPAGAKTQVAIAVDRANLHPGPYTAHVNFLSNVGSSNVTVTMQVIPLEPGHNAVLQLSPAVLSFTAPDGGAAPSTQTITISNPGVLPLQWNASTNASWLAVSPNSGTVQNASSSVGGTTTAPTTQDAVTQSVSVSINTSALLPGTYSGLISFTGQGQVKNSSQDVLVTITITPQCSLQVLPSLLTFASVYQQLAPASKTLNIGAMQSSCTTPLQWSATSASSWLILGASSGTTPAYPSVSVNSTGLQPGTYNSSIVFTTSAGTDTVPVSFTISQSASPIMNVSSASLAYAGVVGQVGPVSQSVVVTNSVGGLLKWQASVATSLGGNWLSVTPSSGSLTGSQAAALSVSVAQLNTPGTYTGTVTFIGTDEAGHAAPGSPQVIPVSFVVQAACAVTTGPSSLTFTSVVGQVAVTPQILTIAASSACAHGVTWTATSATAWLVPTPAAGVAKPGAAGVSSIGIASAGLKAGSYASSVTLTAVDTFTHQALGAPVVVPVALTVQQACTLQPPSVATEAFTATPGQKTAAQTFTLGVSGACTGNVTVTPTVTLGSGTGWLTVTPATATVLSGGAATFTVTVISTTLKAGSYGGSITLAGVNGGATVTGSPQTVGITLTVSSPGSIAASAGAATTHGTDGVTAQPVNIANTGGTALNWSASLTNAPSFITLGTTSGTLAAGTNTSTGVVVNAVSAVAGSYTANVTVTATDSATGLAATGSPTTVAITIKIAPPTMQVSTTSLTYSTPAGTSPSAQSVNVSNIGGGTLTWTAGAPSASWLNVSPASGSDAPNVTSSPTFSVNSSNFAAGTYTATVAITPSVGSPVTVTVTLTVTAVAPTPTPTTVPTPTPTTVPTLTATIAPTATTAPSPTATTQPTIIPTP